MNAFERETIVNASDGDDIVRIWSAQKKFIRRLMKNERVTLVDSREKAGEIVSASFEIAAEHWNPVTGIKRKGRALTPEEKAAASQRLAAARNR